MTGGESSPALFDRKTAAVVNLAITLWFVGFVWLFMEGVALTKPELATSAANAALGQRELTLPSDGEVLHRGTVVDIVSNTRAGEVLHVVDR